MKDHKCSSPHILPLSCYLLTSHPSTLMLPPHLTSFHFHVTSSPHILPLSCSLLTSHPSTVMLPPHLHISHMKDHKCSWHTIFILCVTYVLLYTYVWWCTISIITFLIWGIRRNIIYGIDRSREGGSFGGQYVFKMFILREIMRFQWNASLKNTCNITEV